MFISELLLFFPFLTFTRISKFLLKLLCSTTINKAHQKNVVIINFKNKQERIIIIIIIIIIEKKIAVNSFSGEKNRRKILVGKKKVGEKFRWGKI